MAGPSLFLPHMAAFQRVCLSACWQGRNAQRLRGGHPKVEAKSESGPVFPESCRSHWQRVMDVVGLPLECLSTYDLLPKPWKTPQTDLPWRPAGIGSSVSCQFTKFHLILKKFYNVMEGFYRDVHREPSREGGNILDFFFVFLLNIYLITFEGCDWP